MKSKAVSSLLAFLLAIQFPCGQCGFGGYVDPTFNCPATITCPLVCVSFYEECPPQMRCPEPLLPCADGSCDAFCNNTNLVSPCEKECASVATTPVLPTLARGTSTNATKVRTKNRLLKNSHPLGSTWSLSWCTPGCF